MLFRSQTYLRRNQIIQERHHHNTVVWESVRKIHSLLGVHGMSSDETECDGRAKSVRRIKKPWINESISFMWQQVENLYSPLTIGNRLKSGNKPLQRLWDAQISNFNSVIVPGLPRNFYSSDFLSSLTPLRLRQLRLVDDYVAIPDLSFA